MSTPAATASAAAPQGQRRAREAALRIALLCAPALVLLIVFFAFPLIGNALRSLGLDAQAAPSQTSPWSNYEKLFVDPYYRGVIVETIKVSFIATLLCLALGYPIAHFMVRRAGRLAMPMLFLLIAPLLTSIIMRTFGWRVLFARHGPFNDLLMWLHLIERPLRVLGGPLGVYIGIVHVMVPFMVLSIVPVLRGVDRRLEESARILGAGAARTFLLVTLPLAMEGILTGCVLVFMLTSGSFVTQLLLGDGSVVTLPLLIFQQFSLTQDLGFASAMGNLLLVIVLACLYVQLRVAGRKGDAR
ncbi:ABC transporter permease [Caballeronia sp. LZ034LL]|uniref:ABC transporter permease n=1 Tax=Caballeronia sp. LZ034LL TaxID=3038567 RepID=UPI00285DB546|nr:ABC transporter permease [Caballeronia sp. LZ034LL]MDR5839439.1 ABC transporter permease [Caballeronia sp. LZ034LL]